MGHGTGRVVIARPREHPRQKKNACDLGSCNHSSDHGETPQQNVPAVLELQESAALADLLGVWLQLVQATREAREYDHRARQSQDTRNEGQKASSRSPLHRLPVEQALEDLGGWP